MKKKEVIQPMVEKQDYMGISVQYNLSQMKYVNDMMVLGAATRNHMNGILLLEFDTEHEVI